MFLIKRTIFPKIVLNPSQTKTFHWMPHTFVFLSSPLLHTPHGSAIDCTCEWNQRVPGSSGSGGLSVYTHSVFSSGRAYLPSRSFSHRSISCQARCLPDSPASCQDGRPRAAADRSLALDSSAAKSSLSWTRPVDVKWHKNGGACGMEKFVFERRNHGYLCIFVDERCIKL